MNDIIEYALEELKNKLETNQMEQDKANNFISYDDYEDEYSHNEIDAFQTEFVKYAKEYLIQNYLGQYVITVDWCVHILSSEFFNKCGLRHGTHC